MSIPPLPRGLPRTASDFDASKPEASGPTVAKVHVPLSAKPNGWRAKETGLASAPVANLGGPVSLSPTDEGPPGIALAAGLFLSPTGHIVWRARQAAPLTNQELGAALTDAAEAMGRGMFPFAKQGIPFGQKALAFENLSKAIDLGLDAANFNGNAAQAMQTRAAAAPLLLDLAESLKVSNPAERALFQRLFERYVQATKAEPHADLRAFMSADLARIKAFLPPHAHPDIDALAAEIVPPAGNGDLDHDGVMDNWDHLFTVNAFKVAPVLEHGLHPHRPPVPGSQLNAQALTASVFSVGEMLARRGVPSEQAPRQLFSAGFYDGNDDDPLFQLKEVHREDGGSAWQVKMNSQFAHASEPVLEAALGYTLGRELAVKSGLTESEARASGLLMAAKILESISPVEGAAVWKTVLSHFGLPAYAISLEQVRDASRATDTDSAAILEKLKSILE